MNLYDFKTGIYTDFYEITMAYGYWKSGIAEKRAIFQMFFRKNPMNGGYSVFAGLDTLMDYFEKFGFSEEDIDYLKTFTDLKGKKLFDKDFLEYLKNMRFSCDVMAFPEGSVAFPNEPVIKVVGPIIQAQLVESMILNVINFQTLIATKAARICSVAQGGVLEFGLRRAQGIDGALSATRAAYIGGCTGTSNVLAGKYLGIPVKGTHAHSWVMAFENEIEAFKTYAKIYPDNSIFLVDTYNTIEGIKNAIKVAKKMKKQNHKLIGIRIDSGDLAYLSIKAREMLDKEGLNDCKIIASSSLDESIILSLRNQGAKIDMWGVGTKLSVGYPDAALDGVYKLSAIEKKGKWDYKIKISDNPFKVSITGNPLVKRYYNKDGMVEADIIYDEFEKKKTFKVVRDPYAIWRSKKIKSVWKSKEMLKTIIKNGRIVIKRESLKKIRERVQKELNTLHPGHKRFINPHEYPVGISENLFNVRKKLIEKLSRK